MHARLEKGDTLENKYVILKQLGEGGMGVVYQCRHLDLNKLVAVKVLLPFEASDNTMIERFKVEARSSASIKHNNVVEVYDYGITPDGRPFFVMELLEGQSLASVLDKQGRMNERDIVDIIDQVLTGLGSAHKRKIVHRDLKPENIFLTRNDDGKRVAKILDFGIAKITGGGGSTRITGAHRATNFTNTGGGRLQTEKGVVMGTPGYMAPETLNGLGKIDNRADLYAVGVILYEMLTGRLPFSGDDPAKIMMETATRPVPSLRTINPRISEPMEQLCLIALAKDPVDRFQNTAEFIAYLSAAAVGRYPDGARKCKTRVGMPSVIPPPPSGGPPAPIPLASVKEQPLTLELDIEPPPARPALLRDRAEISAPAPTPARPYIGPARTHRPMFFIPWGKIIFILGLAGACYYFFYYKSRFRNTQVSTEHGYNIGAAPAINDSRTTPTLVPKINIWLDLSPADATVLIDGAIISDRPLRIPVSNRPSRVEVISPGYTKHMTILTPTHEQTLSVHLIKETAPAPVAPKKRNRR